MKTFFWFMLASLYLSHRQNCLGNQSSIYLSMQNSLCIPIFEPQNFKISPFPIQYCWQVCNLSCFSSKCEDIFMITIIIYVDVSVSSDFMTCKINVYYYYYYHNNLVWWNWHHIPPYTNAKVWAMSVYYPHPYVYRKIDYIPVTDHKN